MHGLEQFGLIQFSFLLLRYLLQYVLVYLVWWGGFNNLNGETISLGTLFLFISMSGLLFRPLKANC